MNQLNSTLLEGNLTKPSEMKYSTTGTPICSLSVANNRSFKKGDEWKKEVSFFDVTIFGKLAENCAKLEKGQMVRVVGRLKQDKWQQEDGTTKTRVVIIGEHVEWMNKKKEQQE
jgi:single-strand DNA-binding protein